jgi:cytochrome c peroxidase
MPGKRLVLWLVLSSAMLACDAAGAFSGDGANVAPARQSPAAVPPIPVAGALAQPRPTTQLGLPRQPPPWANSSENSSTPQEVALGEQLFFEGRLSEDNTVACATCHDPARAFTDGRAVSIGIHGLAGQRNSPTILNAVYNKAQFWDGRARTLEDQAALPIINPVEMGQPTLAAAVAQIAGIEHYRREFQSTFGRSVNAADLLRAIAAYERTLVSFDSPFDHFIAGDSSAINASAKRGWELFNTKARCNKCHAPGEKQRDPTYFTDFDYHNIGIGILKHNVGKSAREAEQQIASGKLEEVDRAAIESDLSVLGRFLLTKRSADTAAFKTPNLRNVLVTAPYFHDGSQNTLWDVMDHYNKGDGLKDPWLDEDIQPLALTETDIDDVVEFLASLTSPQYRKLGAQELARQRALARVSRPQRDTSRAFAPKPPQAVLE